MTRKVKFPPWKPNSNYHASAVHFVKLQADNSTSGIFSLIGNSSATLVSAGWTGNYNDGAFTGFGFAGLNTGGMDLGIFSNDDGTIYFALDLFGASGSLIVELINASIPVDPRAGWLSWAYSVDTSTQTAQVMINRTLYALTGAWHSSNPIGLADAAGPWEIDSAQPQNDVSLDTSDYVFIAGSPFFDLSDTANKNKLFSVTNKPISWGDGTSITGATPQFMLRGNAATYLSNDGSGGSFVNTGNPGSSITNASTSPSD